VVIRKIFKNKDLSALRVLLIEGRIRKSLIPSRLLGEGCRRSLQNIVKERLTRKIFPARDLADRCSRPAFDSYIWTTLRCKCARFHCPLLDSRVKVGCHKECDFCLWKSVEAELGTVSGGQEIFAKLRTRKGGLRERWTRSRPFG